MFEQLKYERVSCKLLKDHPFSPGLNMERELGKLFQKALPVFNFLHSASRIDNNLWPHRLKALHNPPRSTGLCAVYTSSEQKNKKQIKTISGFGAGSAG